MTDESQVSGPAGQTVYIQQAPAQQGNGFATASLVIGILALVTSLIPIIGMIAWLLSPLGLIFGGIAFTKPTGRGSAIGGLICSGIALVICLAWGLLFGAAAAAASAGATT